MQVKTFNVQFILKTDKTNKKGLSPIFARIRINGKKMEITTSRSIASEKWLSGLSGKSIYQYFKYLYHFS
jgi:hypothetical protein